MALLGYQGSGDPSESHRTRAESSLDIEYEPEATRLGSRES